MTSHAFRERIEPSDQRLNTDIIIVVVTVVITVVVVVVVIVVILLEGVTRGSLKSRSGS